MTVETKPSNLDLRKRRKVLGISLDEIGSLLGGVDTAALSRFERGYRDGLPNGLTRADYEALLDRLESERAEAVA